MKATDLGETELEGETSKTSSWALVLSESPQATTLSNRFSLIYHFSVFNWWEAPAGAAVDAGGLCIRWCPTGKGWGGTQITPATYKLIAATRGDGRYVRRSRPAFPPSPDLLHSTRLQVRLAEHSRSLFGAQIVYLMSSTFSFSTLLPSK